MTISGTLTGKEQAAESVVVAQIEPVGGHGGMNFYDSSLCRALVLAGCIPVLYTCDRMDSMDQKFEIQMRYMGVFGSDPAWLRGLRFIRGSVASVLDARRKGCRIAHFHFFQAGPLELFNLMLARVAGMRTVVTAHDVEAFVGVESAGRVGGLCYRLTNAFVAHNQVSRDELVNMKKVAPESVHVIPHGNYIDFAESSPMDRRQARALLGCGSDEFVLLFFGQIKIEKGLDILLRALPGVVSASRRRVRLVIAGRPFKQDFARYQSIIAELKINRYVDLHLGYVSDDRVSAFYGAADVVVLPYRRIYQSGVALMALSFGVPIVVSDIPGMKEMMDDGEAGLFFADGDSQDLASRLSWMANHTVELAAMRGRALEVARKRYDWTDVGRRIAMLYRGLLVERIGRAGAM